MKRTLSAVIIILLSVLCAEENLQDETSADYPNIGIALSGGGLRGIAHIGVLRRLEEEGIVPYMISGSSMGALVGGLYCLGYNSYEIEEIIKEAESEDVFTNRPDRDMTENYIKKTSDRTVVELELTKSGIQMPNALNNGHNILKKIRYYTNRSEYYSSNFDKLKYKLRIICSDIQNSKKIVFKEGDIPLLISASMSFPGLFRPVLYENMLLLDGGLTDNIPVGALEDCDVIIASNTTHDTPAHNEEYNFIELLDRISVLMTKSNIESSLETADIVLRPEVENVSVTEMSDPDSLIKLGYEEASRKIDQIKEILGRRKITKISKSSETDKSGSFEITGNRVISREELLNSVSEFKDIKELPRLIISVYKNRGYLLCDAFVTAGTPDTVKVEEGYLKRINIIGDYSTKKRFIRDEIAVSTKKILRIEDLERSVDNLYGTGLFHKVHYEIDRKNCEVTFHVQEKPYNLIRLGANYQTDRGFLGLAELANKNLHGKRAEIYGGLTFGESFNRIEFSYYNPFLKRSTLFFEILPYYQIKERKFYDSDHEILTDLIFDEERYGADLNLGFQFFDNYQGVFTLIHEIIDIDGISDTRTSAIFKILADSRDDQIVPGRGVYLEWNIESGIYNFEKEDRFQKTWWEFSLYNNIRKRINLGIGVAGGTGDNLVPFNERYLAGGIKMMPGTFNEEYSVVQYFRVKNKMDVLVKDSSLFDLYISLGYYLNALWDNEPEIKWNYRKFTNSFYSGLIFYTKLAPVEAGFGITAGNGTIKQNSRLFLSVGYPLQ